MTQVNKTFFLKFLYKKDKSEQTLNVFRLIFKYLYVGGRGGVLYFDHSLRRILREINNSNFCHSMVSFEF